MVVYAVTSSQQTAVASSKHSTPNVGLSHTLSDLDGDGSSDAILVSRGNPRFMIELQLSRTQTYHVLPFPTTTTDQGSLWVQDFDGDGDDDLLWKSSLPLYTAVLWVNDGYGRFECICPPDRQHHRATFIDYGLSLAPSHAITFLSLPDSSPSPGQMLAKSWALATLSRFGKPRPGLIWKQVVLSPFFNKRGPPVRLLSTNC